MKKYSAFVQDKVTKEWIFIKNIECNSKAQFIDDLRSNGYRVNPMKVLESKYFDFVMDYTNADPWDWKNAKQDYNEYFK